MNTSATKPRKSSGAKWAVAIVCIVLAFLVVVGAGVWAFFHFDVLSLGEDDDDDEIERLEDEDEDDEEDDAGDDVASSPAAAVDLAAADVGDVVEFGSYSQSAASSSETEIRWYVAAIEDGKALLVSEQVLFCSTMSYYEDEELTWLSSDLRWELNDDFLYDAFTDDEIAKINWVEVEHDEDYYDYEYDDYYDYCDQVFLLSSSEATSYLSSDQLLATATAYAEANGVTTYTSDGAANWWLRDSNGDGTFVNVFYDGTVNSGGYIASQEGFGVRPALWVTIDGEAEEVSTQNSDGSTTVTLTVESADGTILSGEVTRDADGYVIADSSTREYTKEELEALGLNDAELAVARNEPFARQGYHFKNDGLRAYFESCDWYTDTGNSNYLTGVAAVNNTLLIELSNESDTSGRWTNLKIS